jgi:hypothetical protein
MPEISAPVSLAVVLGVFAVTTFTGLHAKPVAKPPIPG